AGSAVAGASECGDARQICRTERYLLPRQNVTRARELLVFGPRTQRVDALSCSRNLRTQVRQYQHIRARYLLTGKIAEHDQCSVATGGKLRNRLTTTQELRVEHVSLAWQCRSLRDAACRNLSPRLQVGDGALLLGALSLLQQRREVCVVDVLTQSERGCLNTSLRRCKLCALDAASCAHCRVVDRLLRADVRVVRVMRRNGQRQSVRKLQRERHYLRLILPLSIRADCGKPRCIDILHPERRLRR